MVVDCEAAADSNTPDWVEFCSHTEAALVAVRELLQQGAAG